MALTQSFVADTAALAEDVNDVLEDIRDEITNSLAADGQTSMTAAIKGFGGNVTVPGYGFGGSSDANTGFWRKAADTPAVTAGGTEVQNWTAGASTLTGNMTVTGLVTGATGNITGDLAVGGNLTITGTVSSFPSGTKALFVQTAAPTGWTKDTTHNDKALRIVSGTASSGGTNAFSTVMAQTATGSHSITQANLPATVAIPLTYTNTSGAYASGAALSAVTAIASGTSLNTDITLTSVGGSGTGHTHTFTMSMAFVDVIIATKD
jgi:hypothetical protein